MCYATVAFLFLMADAGVVPTVMREIVRTRLVAADRFVTYVVYDWYHAPYSADPTDMSQWQRVSPISRTEHRVTVVRPNIKHELLTDDPPAGFVPVVECIIDGRYRSTQRGVDQRSRRGIQIISETPAGKWNSGNFQIIPFLQCFELHCSDSTIPGLNFVSIFDHADVRLITARGQRSVYQASVRMDAWWQDFEFEVEPDGLIVRTSARYRYDRELPSCSTQEIVLASDEVNGVRIPTEVVFATRNDNVSTEFQGIRHIVLNGVSHIPGLSRDDVDIDMPTRDAVYHSYNWDGSERYTHYGPEGTVVDQRDLAAYIPEPLPEGVVVVPQANVRWVALVPVVCIAAAISTSLALWKVGRPGLQTRR